MKLKKLSPLLTATIAVMMTVSVNANETPLKAAEEELFSTKPAKSWSYEFEPYMLVTSISGDAGIGRSSGVPIDVDFSDILENLDIGAMAHFEAHHESGWGVWIDYGFMDLSSDITGPVNGITSASVRQGVLETLGMYRQKLSYGDIDYLAGVRWWDNDINVLHSSLPIDINVKEDWIDLVVGARWTTPINEYWSFNLLGTAGGFGLESDFTASSAIGVKYVISDLVDLNLQYKATWVDYENGIKRESNYFMYDTVTYGPLIGLSFKW